MLHKRPHTAIRGPRLLQGASGRVQRLCAFCLQSSAQEGPEVPASVMEG